jgi:hypothetical protein
MSRLRLVIVAIIVIALLGLGVWFLTTGSLDVTTSKGGAITVQQLNATNPKTFTAKSSFHRRVKPGSYLINVSDSPKESEKVVTVKRLSSTPVQLSLRDISPVTKVYGGIQAGSFISNGPAITFTESETHTLQQVSEGQPEPGYTSANFFGDIFYSQLNSSGMGVWIGDIKGVRNVVEYNKGNLTTINTAGISNPSKISSASISPNGSIVIASEKNIYLLDTPTARPKQIYSSEHSDLLVWKSNTKLLVSYVQNQDTKEGSVLFDLSDQHTRSLDKLVTDAQWSADGKNLAIRTSDGGYITDDALGIQRQFSGEISSIAWRGAGSLIYGRDSNLWEYNLGSGTSTKLSNSPLTQAIEGIYSDGSSNIYFSANGGISSAIYRITTPPQSLSTKLTTLQTALPIEDDGFSIDLINITRPVLVIKIRPDLSPDYQNQLKQNAMKALSDRKLDVVGIPITYATLDED